MVAAHPRCAREPLALRAGSRAGAYMQQSVLEPVGITVPDSGALAEQVGAVGVPLKITPGELTPVPE